jgi:Aspartyl protease
MSTRATSSHFRPILTCLAALPLGWACFGFDRAYPAQVKVDDVATVLASMRQAAGRPVLSGRPAELLVEGKVDRAGLTSDFSLRFAPAGMFLETIAGRLPGQLGFNGKVCWSTDLSGMPERLELHDLDRNRLWFGMRTGQWLSTANVDLSKAKVPRDEVILDIKQGRFKAKVHVSRDTWLPKSLDSAGVEGPETWTFADHRRFAGLNLPGKVTRKQAGQTETYRVVSIRPAPEASAAVYDEVTRPDDTVYNPAAPADVPLKRVMTGHLLVRPQIDGRDIGWFIFDTGAAGNVIDPKAMAKLRLEPLGTAGVTSVRGNEPSSIVQATSIALGPMTVAKPFFVTMELGYIREAMGEDVFGIIGHDSLSRCVAEITLADDSIKLFDPKKYRLGSGSWQPLTFNQSVPVISGKFEGDRTGLFRIDTGAGGPGGAGNVVFHAPAVNDLHLLKGRKVNRMKFGKTNVAMGTVAWFEVAGHRFEHPNVVFAIDRQGPFGDDYVEGNIGVDFLKPFRMVLDFQNTRVAFLPRVRAER